MVEVKEKDFVKGVVTTLKEVELKVNRNNEEQIDKVIWHTDGGQITWKPKILKETFEGGFKVSKTVPMERGILPKKLIEMAQICSEKGSCQIKVNYHVWNTQADGNPVTYRYVVHEKTFEDWEIIKEGTTTETVLP